MKIDNFEKNPEINIKNQDDKSVVGKISDNVESIYLIDSKFLFLSTEKRFLKRKAFNLFYREFNENMYLFSPSFKKER